MGTHMNKGGSWHVRSDDGGITIMVEDAHAAVLE